MCEPLVSVVIPVYNGADYLREAIDSVLNQTYSNIEIIVVNDGSIDHGQTEAIARSYGNRIRYIYKENGGVATALNAGIKEMNGEYFSWLSHDDIFYPDKVQKQIQLLKETNKRIAACAYHIFFDSGRKVPVPFISFYGNESIQSSVFSVLHALIQFGGVLFKKELFNEYGDFREDLKTTQDYEFLFRILRKEKCVFSDELLYGIRYHSNQGSNTIDCVNIERDEMYQMFMQSLSRTEKEYIYGSAYNFYYQMLLRIWPIPEMYKSLQHCKDSLCHEKGRICLADTGLIQPVLIYGAGMYGRRLLFDLRCRGIKVEGFLDSSQSLTGKKVDGVTCYSLRDVENGVVKGTIMIASIFREEIAATLREKGIEPFCFKETYERKVLQTAPEWANIKEVMSDYDV